MNKLLQFSILIVCLVCSHYLTVAQSNESKSKAYSAELTQKLTGLTEGMPSNMQIMFDGKAFPIYQTDGTSLSEATAMEFLMSNQYRPVFYLNDKGETKACVFQALSTEEQEAMKALRADMKSSKNALMGKSISFSAVDMEGNKVSLEDLKGKVVVVNFWFTACKPCIMEMPELNELVEKYAEQEVVFLAPTFNTKAEVEVLMEKKSFDYRILPNMQEMIDQYKVVSYPTHLVMDQDGKVIFTTSALTPTTIQNVENAIKKALEK